MLTEIFLDNNFKLFKSSNGSNSLDNLNRINIFIGENNSGKSRLVRALFSTEFDFVFSEVNTRDIKVEFEKLKSKIEQYFFEVGVGEVDNILKKLNEFNEKLAKYNSIYVNQLINEILSFWDLFYNITVTGYSHLEGRNQISKTAKQIEFDLRTFAEEINHKIRKLIPIQFDYSLSKIYIPILRGLRPTQHDNAFKFNETIDNYSLRTLRDYFDKKEILADKIYTGLRLYNDAKKMLLGKQAGRLEIKSFEDFISRNFFNSKPFTLIPNIEDDSLHVSIDNEEKAHL